ncbi:methyltransferase family protein [Chloroflexota bacterium]
MSPVPAFEIGVWNVWLLLLPLVLIPIIVASAKKGLFKKTESTANLSKIEKRIFLFSKIVLMLSFLYSIFLPLKLGTLWFYVGLLISLLGIAMFIVVGVSVANTPVGAPVTTGLYRYSRHPMYVASFPALVGAGIASASWLFLLLAVLITITHFMNAIFEERLCLEAYGSVYQEYLNMTPRWIGVPKSY